MNNLYWTRNKKTKIFEARGLGRFHYSVGYIEDEDFWIGYIEDDEKKFHLADAYHETEELTNSTLSHSARLVLSRN